VGSLRVRRAPDVAVQDDREGDVQEDREGGADGSRHRLSVRSRVEKVTAELCGFRAELAFLPGIRIRKPFVYQAGVVGKLCSVICGYTAITNLYPLKKNEKKGRVVVIYICNKRNPILFKQIVGCC
jgi:hypothetical protein